LLKQRCSNCAPPANPLASERSTCDPPVPKSSTSAFQRAEAAPTARSNNASAAGSLPMRAAAQHHVAPCEPCSAESISEASRANSALRPTSAARRQLWAGRVLRDDATGLDRPRDAAIGDVAEWFRGETAAVAASAAASQTEAEASVSSGPARSISLARDDRVADHRIALCALLRGRWRSPRCRDPDMHLQALADALESLGIAAWIAVADSIARSGSLPWRWRAEQRHHRIADMLVDAPAEPQHDRIHRLEEACQQPMRVFGIQSFRQSGVSLISRNITVTGRISPQWESELRPDELSRVQQGGRGGTASGLPQPPQNRSSAASRIRRQGRRPATPGRSRYKPDAPGRFAVTARTNACPALSVHPGSHGPQGRRRSEHGPLHGQPVRFLLRKGQEHCESFYPGGAMIICCGEL